MITGCFSIPHGAFQHQYLLRVMKASPLIDARTAEMSAFPGVHGQVNSIREEIHATLPALLHAPAR